MKGLLYESFLLNRRCFLATGIMAALFTATFSIMLPNTEPDPEIANTLGIMYIFVALMVMVLCSEWTSRHLEKNIKCRFADITLAAGISKNTFVLAEFLKIFISVMIGFAMCMAMTGIISIFESGFFNSGKVKLLSALAVFGILTEWAITPLVIKLKSSEKAGLILGLIVGIGIVLPLVLIFGRDMENIPVKLITLLSKKWLFPAFLGACAALYAAVYAITLRLVKRGDVC